MPSYREQPVRLEVIEKMSALASAGFGLVAALAWNDAIQSLVNMVFGTANGLIAKFVYALLITAIVVVITVHVGRLASSVRRARRQGR